MDIRRWLARPEVSALAMVMLLSGVFQAANPAFLTLANIATMLRALALPGLIAVGMAPCLMAGTIDLSVGAAAGLSASLAAVLMVNQGWPIWSALLAAVIVTGAVGAVNCYVIFRYKLMAFITTIGMMYVLKSLAVWITNGSSIYPIPPGLVAFGQAHPLGLSWPFLIFAGAVVVIQVVLSTTVWGLEVRATGSDRTIARDTEVRVDLVNYSTFILLGLLSGVSGLCAMARITAGNPTIGTGWEFQAILGCALGGVSLFGHDGSMAGMVLGLLLMQVITTGLVEIGVSPYLEGALLGGLLIGALVLDVRKRSLLRQQD